MLRLAAVSADADDEFDVAVRMLDFDHVDEECGELSPESVWCGECAYDDA
jgi:hypothetical protein